VTPLVFVGIAVAGGLGAGLRYTLEMLGRRLFGDRLPWGVLAVNLSGAFALGLISAGLLDATGTWVVGTGLLGGYTTFSSVAVATVLLAEEGRTRAALGYAIGTFAGSVALAAAGLALGALAR
jgi:fluoride exporter